MQKDYYETIEEPVDFDELNTLGHKISNYENPNLNIQNEKNDPKVFLNNLQ